MSAVVCRNTLSECFVKAGRFLMSTSTATSCLLWLESHPRLPKGARLLLWVLVVSKRPWGCRPWQPGPGCVSGRDRSDQRFDPDNVHDPCQIIGQNRESHLGGYFWKCFCEEVRRSHARLHRSERMLDCLSTLAHRFGVCVEAPLHGLEHG